MAKATKKKLFEGEWYINNSVGRQSLRNLNGQNVVMEVGDVYFVLNMERSILRVMRSQSHFMRYGGSLLGRHCIFPVDADSPKVGKRAILVETAAQVIAAGIHEDMFNDKTAGVMKAYAETIKAAA